MKNNKYNTYIYIIISLLIIIILLLYIINLLNNNKSINIKNIEKFDINNSIINYKNLLNNYKYYINNNNYDLLNNNYNELNNRYTNVNYETEKINKVDNIENCKNEIELITKSPNDIIGDLKNEICNYENINFEPRIINNKEYIPGNKLKNGNGNEKHDLVIYKKVDKYENSYNYNDLDNNDTSREL